MCTCLKFLSKLEEEKNTKTNLFNIVIKLIESITFEQRTWSWNQWLNICWSERTSSNTWRFSSSRHRLIETCRGSLVYGPKNGHIMYVCNSETLLLNRPSITSTWSLNWCWADLLLFLISFASLISSRFLCFALESLEDLTSTRTKWCLPMKKI